MCGGLIGVGAVFLVLEAASHFSFLDLTTLERKSAALCKCLPSLIFFGYHLLHFSISMATTAAMAYVAATVVSSKPTFFFSQKCLSPLSHTSFSLNSPFSKINNSNFLFSSIPKLKPLSVTIKRSLSFSPIIPHASTNTFHGLCYVLSDNIDTDQIIPAEHLTLVPSKPDEYRKLGSLAFSGLPSSSYPIPFIDPAQPNSLYSIILAGANFGCGSSREHAPVALGAAGIRAVVAESYARIFFRNSVATGEVYPLESEGRICDECNTGDVITIELDQCRLINHTTGKEYQLKPIGDAGPVIEAGGIFAYARKTGMIASTPAA